MDTWELHKAVIAYGETMRLAGVFLGRRDMDYLPYHSRALQLSTYVHSRIILSNSPYSSVRKLP